MVVRLIALGVNPLDWKLYSGTLHEVGGEHSDTVGTEKEVPLLGLEGVDGVRVGDVVVAFPARDTYADYIIAPAAATIRKRRHWDGTKLLDCC